MCSLHFNSCLWGASVCLYFNSAGNKVAGDSTDIMGKTVDNNQWVVGILNNVSFSEVSETDGSHAAA